MIQFYYYVFINKKKNNQIHTQTHFRETGQSALD